MTRAEKDEEREERIKMRITVDTDSPEEQTWGSDAYLHEAMDFPFKACCVTEREESRPGEGQDTTTEVRMGTGDTPDTPTSDRITDRTSAAGTTGDTKTAELDLREANVVDVSFEKQNGTYTFDVTLHHDDDGEEGYANRWQVERLDGTRLGRRELLHAHSQQPFTRFDTIDIPEDVTCVVVRGHDQTHGYGGVAIAVNLDSGDTKLRDQGSERRSFDASDCPG